MIEYFHIAKCDICNKQTEKIKTTGITKEKINSSLPKGWICFSRIKFGDAQGSKFILCDECTSEIGVSQE